MTAEGLCQEGSPFGMSEGCVPAMAEPKECRSAQMLLDARRCSSHCKRRWPRSFMYLCHEHHVGNVKDGIQGGAPLALQQSPAAGACKRSIRSSRLYSR